MTLKHLHDLTCQSFDFNHLKKIKAVIGVPVHFTHSQRGDDAGRDGGGI